MLNQKRGRGRPKKIKLTDDEKLEEILFKAYNFYIDKNGDLKLERNTTPLTLEETSFLLWNIESKKTSKPMSNMNVIKIERSALTKMRKGLNKIGITNFSDVFDSRYRMNAKCADIVHTGE